MTTSAFEVDEMSEISSSLGWRRRILEQKMVGKGILDFGKSGADVREIGVALFVAGGGLREESLRDADKERLIIAKREVRGRLENLSEMSLGLRLCMNQLRLDGLICGDFE
ncbi:hypothetical protein ACOME3_002813 [Neoechinorhynchus agilis]